MLYSMFAGPVTLPICGDAPATGDGHGISVRHSARRHVQRRIHLHPQIRAETELDQCPWFLVAKPVTGWRRVPAGGCSARRALHRGADLAFHQQRLPRSWLQGDLHAFLLRADAVALT